MEMILTLDSIDNFRSSLSAKGRSENTQKAYTSDLMEFLAWTPKPVTRKNFDRAATDWLNQFKKELAPRTTGRRMTALRAYARWAKYPSNNLAEYKAPTPGRTVPHPIPEGIEGVLALLNEAKNNRQKALITLCGLCGLRVTEALSVTPAQFNVTDMTLTVRGKGDVTRTVPVSTRAWKELLPAVVDAVSSGTDKSVVGYKDRFARQIISDCAKRASLKRRVASHDLRATFATAVYDKTLDLRVTQELLGHASSKTTETYTAVSVNKMRVAADIA